MLSPHPPFLKMMVGLVVGLVFLCLTSTVNAAAIGICYPTSDCSGNVKQSAFGTFAGASNLPKNCLGFRTAREGYKVCDTKGA